MKVVLSLSKNDLEFMCTLICQLDRLYEENDFNEDTDEGVESINALTGIRETMCKIFYTAMNQMELDEAITEKKQNIEQLSFGEMRKLMKRWIIHHAKYDVELSPGMFDRLLEECKRTYWRQS